MVTVEEVAECEARVYWEEDFSMEGIVGCVDDDEASVEDSVNDDREDWEDATVSGIGRRSMESLEETSDESKEDAADERSCSATIGTDILIAGSCPV